MKSFKNLIVWEKAHKLTLATYLTTSHFPKEEIYGLTSQIRRACSSIPANIAEGCGRTGNSEFGRFLQISMGSANELEYHLLLARDLNILNTLEYDNLNNQLVDIKRMLISLIKKVREDKLAE